MSHPSLLLEQPYSAEAEQSLLGGLLLDNSAWDRVIADMIQSGDFYTLDHQLIFRAIEQLFRANQPVDVVTVFEKLCTFPENTASGKEVVGLGYLGEIANSTPSAANIRRYAEIVKERAQLRSLSQIGHECTRLACERGATSAHVQEKIEQRLYRLAQFKQGNEFIDINQGLTQVVETIERNFSSGNHLTGTPTGLIDLDELTAGFQSGDLVIVAGRPGMGKTGLALGWIRHVLEDEACRDTSVQFYSMEMPAQQILFRLISQEVHLPVKALMQGKLTTDDDWSRLSLGLSKIHQNAHRLILDDSPALSPTALRAKARRSARQHGQPKLIVIDYLQLMRLEHRAENRTQEVSEISRSLKELAKELACPIVALSQLNRSLEQRPNKRPVMADIRESGAIEQDADLIAFVYRDEVYNSDSSDRGTAEIIIGKHRNGPTGMVRAAFIGEEARFANLDKNSFYAGRML